MFKKLLIACLVIFALSVTESQAQCDNNELQITLTTGSFGNEVSFSINDLATGDSLIYETGFSSFNTYDFTLCVDDGCYMVQAFDSFGDGWNGAEISLSVDGEEIGSYTLEFGEGSSFGVYGFGINSEDCLASGCADPSACNFNSEASWDDGSCTYPGCMDELASNYNPSAGCEDPDTCTYPCEEGLIPATLYVCTFSNGANVNLSIVDDAGNVVFEQFGFPNVTIEYLDICLEEGVCYTATMSNDVDPGWYGGYFWVNAGGVQIVNDQLDIDLNTESVDFSVDGTCGEVYGCTDVDACNYDSTATSNSGCYYPGCMDETATNYSPWMGCEDNSLCTYPVECEDGQTLVSLYVCTFSNKQNVNLEITDDAGNVIFSSFGFTSAIEYYDLCLEPGTCYTATMSNDVDPGWYGGYFWVNGGGIEYVNESLDVDLNTETVDFSIDGTCGPVYGCNDETACNYNSEATSNDGSCTYPGCTDAFALNYNPFAGCDDDSCEYLEDCESNAVSALLSTGTFGSEISWNLINSSGETVASGFGTQSNFISVQSFCADDDCYTVEMIDSFGDGWNGGSITFLVGEDSYGPYTIETGGFGIATFGINSEDCSDIAGCMDVEACNYNATATEDNGSCTYPGCNDPNAMNYDPEAGCNDGSCAYEYEECENLVSIVLHTDAFGSEMAWELTDDNGNIISGGDTYASNQTIYMDSLCLDDGCYTINMYDSFGDGWNFGDSNGFIEVFSSPDDFLNDESYYGTGTIEDGSFNSFTFGLNSECESESTDIFGCMDSLAINFNPLATIDDGSCVYLDGECEALFGIFDIIEEEDLVIIVNLSTGENLTYMWDFGDGTTSEEEFPIHFYDEDGVYNVCLTVTSWDGFEIACASTYCLLVEYESGNFTMEDEDGNITSTEGGFSINIVSEESTIISVDETTLDPNAITLYPNPTSDVLNISISSSMNSEMDVQIIDIAGRVVYAQSNKLNDSNTSIDVSQLSNGMYLLVFNNNQEVITKRFEISK